MNSTTIFQEVTIRVAYETYGGEFKALDAVLDAIEESAPIELKVLDYSARDLRLVPTNGAMDTTANRQTCGPTSTQQTASSSQ